MIRFKKQENGNVLITDGNDNVKASFNGHMNVFLHPHQENSLIITDDSAPSEVSKGMVVSFDSVDLSGCNPILTSNSVGELINNLSQDFFFRKPVVSNNGEGGGNNGEGSGNNEGIYQGEFSAYQDIVLYNGTDFKVFYEASTFQVKVENKTTGWFDVYLTHTKGYGSFNLAIGVNQNIGSFYLSQGGAVNVNYALSNFYSAQFASFIYFKIAKETTTGKEIIYGELMRAGNTINGKLNKMN